jgi:hypothetical protein
MKNIDINLLGKISMHSYFYSLPYLSIFLFFLFLTFPLIQGRRVIAFSILQKYLLFFILIFFMGFRGFIYYDWPGYFSVFSKAPSFFDGIKSIKSFLSGISSEKVFLLLIIFCKTISSSYFFFTLVSYIIDYCILYYFFKRYISDNMIMGFVFFFIFRGFFLEMTLLRNIKAIMIFLISVKYIEERKIIYYFCIYIIGALFHVMALLFLPLYFITNKQYPKWIVIAIFFIGSIVSFFSIQWIKMLLANLLNFLPLDSRVSFLIERYTVSTAILQTRNVSITIPKYLEIFILFFSIFFFQGKLIEMSKSNIIFINSAYLYFYILLFCREMFVLIERLPLIFIFSLWVLYPQIYKIFSKNNKYIFIVFFLLYGSLIIVHNNQTIMQKYENVLFYHNSYYQKKKILDALIREYEFEIINGNRKRRNQ